MHEAYVELEIGTLYRLTKREHTVIDVDERCIKSCHSDTF